MEKLILALTLSIMSLPAFANDSATKQTVDEITPLKPDYCRYLTKRGELQMTWRNSGGEMSIAMVDIVEPVPKSDKYYFDPIYPIDDEILGKISYPSDHNKYPLSEFKKDMIDVIVMAYDIPELVVTSTYSRSRQEKKALTAFTNKVYLKCFKKHNSIKSN